MSRLFQGGHWWVISFISFSIHARQFDLSMVHAQCWGWLLFFAMLYELVYCIVTEAPPPPAKLWLFSAGKSPMTNKMIDTHTHMHVSFLACFFMLYLVIWCISFHLFIFLVATGQSKRIQLQNGGVWLHRWRVDQLRYPSIITKWSFGSWREFHHLRTQK